MEKLLKKYKGITLISLIVTIIILLILAGITISSLTNSGLFDKVKEAKGKWKNAQNYEEEQIAKYSNEIDNYISGPRSNMQETVLFEGCSNEVKSYPMNDDYRNYKFLYVKYAEGTSGLYKGTVILNTNDITKDVANDLRICSYDTRNILFHFTETNLVIDSLHSSDAANCYPCILSIRGYK